VIISAPDVVEIREEALPDLGADEALVSLLVAGVCGSDLHGMHGSHPIMSPPYYPGHEVVGTVVRVGANVSLVDVGQRVTPEPTLPCNHCKMCATGRSNICENLEFFGCGFREGGMADLFTVDARRLHIVPGTFDLRQASLIEPLATPVHAVRLAGELEGKAVAIIGAGTIGLLVLAAARARGARRIVITDVLEWKREAAVHRGADAAVDAADPNVAVTVRAALGETADVVFDCVANQTTIDAAVEMVQRGGTIVVIGIPSKPVQFRLFALQERQIRLQGAATYLSEDYAEAIEILASGTIDASTMITSTYPLERAAEAFAAAADGSQVKVLITGTGSDLV
jgi:2-desacetyl-2-hydroxyethyl bacteriochlorophyllide A dehydrogenase